MDEEYISLELEQIPWYVELKGKKEINVHPRRGRK